MISIIIPVKNEAHILTNTLNRLQKLRDLRICEIILVDGGSSDNTVKIAPNLVDQILITKSGRAYQQNIGASVAKGDILVFLHADTIISIKQLLYLDKIVKQNKWGFFKIIFDDKRLQYRILTYFINLRSRLCNYGTGDQVLFISRELFNQIGGFPCLKIMEDIKICSILKKLTNPIIVNSYVITSARRWKKNGFIRTILKMRFLRFLYKIGIESEILARHYK